MSDETDAEDLEHGRRERQFDALVEIFCARYGVKKDEIPELLENARWAAEHRSDIGRIGWHAALGAIGSVVVGILVLMWTGLLHALGKGP